MDKEFWAIIGTYLLMVVLWVLAVGALIFFTFCCLKRFGVIS